MMNGMTKAKIAITIPADLLAEVKAAVDRGESSSVSGFISEAVAFSLGQSQGKRPLRIYLDMLKAEHGAPSPEDYAWADEQIRRMGLQPRSAAQDSPSTQAR
jgi:hypothetical protein